MEQVSSPSASRRALVGNAGRIECDCQAGGAKAFDPHDRRARGGMSAARCILPERPGDRAPPIGDRGTARRLGTDGPPTVCQIGIA